MIERLLSKEVLEFIHSHQASDVHELVLKYIQIGGAPISNVVDQIVGRKKAKEKLPTLYKTDGIIFPPSVNLEQSSSEQTALFKTAILRSLSYKKFNHAVDLTGGLGIDTFFLSKIFDRVSYIEPNHSLLEIAKHNHAQLSQTNILYFEDSAEHFLRKADSHVDLFYIDPSRRKSNSRKVLRLADCEPDITKLINIIFQRSGLLLIKASPLLDVQQGIKELKYVKNVYVVSLNNECKELLFLCEKHFKREATIEAINIEKGRSDSFSFQFSQEKMLASTLSEPLTYLYEPNASILKAGAFKSIATTFNLLKLHPNTHLYTSSEVLSAFPGKIFRIETSTKADKKVLRQHLPTMKANITLRNYPLSVADLKKKTNVIEGGERYMIGFTGVRKKYLVIAERIH